MKFRVLYKERALNSLPVALRSIEKLPMFECGLPTRALFRNTFVRLLVAELIGNTEGCCPKSLARWVLRREKL